jgi:hypothetical protein
MSNELSEFQLIEGQKCYERYCTWFGDGSIKGDNLPIWEELSDESKTAWTMITLGRSKVAEYNVNRRCRAKIHYTEEDQLIEGQKCYEIYCESHIKGDNLPIWEELSDESKTTWTLINLGRSKVAESNVNSRCRAKIHYTEEEEDHKH